MGFGTRTPLAKESSITDEIAACYERFGEWKTRWTSTPGKLGFGGNLSRTIDRISKHQKVSVSAETLVRRVFCTGSLTNLHRVAHPDELTWHAEREIARRFAFPKDRRSGSNISVFRAVFHSQQRDLDTYLRFPETDEPVRAFAYKVSPRCVGPASFP